MAKFLLLPALLLLAVQAGAPPQPSPAPRIGQEPATWEQRYARARLALAEAGLRRVEQMNARVANATAATVVAEYRDDVKLAQARLAAAQAGTSLDAFQFWVERAAAASRSAQAQAKGASAANQTMPGTVKPLDLARLQGRAAVSRLLAERAQQLVDRPAAEQLAWQLEFLQWESEQLHEELFRIGRSGGIVPVWPY
jgi:hypothetical protein